MTLDCLMDLLGNNLATSDYMMERWDCMMGKSGNSLAKLDYKKDWLVNNLAR